MKKKLDRYLTRIPSTASKFAAHLLVKFRIIESYQPLADSNGGKRASQERWEHMCDHIPTTGLCLDIGCNTGFFAEKIARRGPFVLGFDMAAKNIIVANAQYNLPNLMFKHFELNPASVCTLPQTDILVFLSVFHHIVKYNGQMAAEQIFETLAARCTKHLFFETGQPDETGTSFSPMLEFMGDVETWTREFLIVRCKFESVTCLGEFPTFLTPVPRKLFLAKR